MATVSNYTVTSMGTVTFSNPGNPTGPFIAWVTRKGVTVPALSRVVGAMAVNYQLPTGYQAGDVSLMQRVSITAAGVKASGPVFKATVPAPLPPPPPTGVPVSAVPSLPASVLSSIGPLEVALLEGFAPPEMGGVELGGVGAMFGPNWTSHADPMYPFNGNERAVFKQDHATLLPGGGLDLACTYTPGVGPSVAGANAACDYTSGCAASLYADPTAGGSAGFPMKGFKWLPQAGVTTILEFDITIPAYLVGLDLGVWWQGAKGQGEIDAFEMMDETVGKPGTSAMILNIIDHVTGESSPNELQVFNSSFLKTGGRGTITFVVTGVSTIAAYLTPHGGTPTLFGSANFPAGWNVTEPMACVLSFSLRDIEADENPTWTAERHVQVWAAKVLTSSAPTAANGFCAGGVAAGTVEV